MATLFRPVGIVELGLLWDLEFRGFPPRLPEQPYFYPVVNLEYATQIARDRNTKDPASGCCGFVTRFPIADSYLAKFRPHVVGSKVHEEYWIPAKQMEQFNRAIEGRVVVDTAFFGTGYRGCLSQGGAFKDRDAAEQFVELAKLWEFNSLDFVAEVSRNRKAVYLNAWFWAQHDFFKLGIRLEEKRLMFERLARAWEMNAIGVTWPGAEFERMIAATALSPSEVEQQYPGKWKNAMSRAGGRVDNVPSEEEFEIQEEFGKKLEEQARERPRGITVLVAGLLLYVAMMIGLVVVGLAWPEILHTGNSDKNATRGAIAAFSAFVIPVRIGFAITLAVGLWELKRWARRLMLVVAGLNVVVGLVTLGLSPVGRRLSWSREIEIVMCIAILAYLSGKRASLAFESGVQEKG